MAEAQDQLRADAGAGRRSPDAIRDEIERTRVAMHETVDALERRLSPGELFEEVWNRVRGDGATSASGVVREHPVPLALMGLGLGWLAIEKATGSDDSARTGEGKATGYSTGIGYYEADALDTDSPVAEDTDEGKLDRVKHKASEMKDKATHLGERASDAKDRAQQGFDRLSERQPLALGAIGFGLGLAAGLIAPTTHWEDEHVGPLSDRIKESARETAHDAEEVVKDVAHEAREVALEAKDSIEQSARETEGMSAGDRIGDAVDRAKEAVQESASRHHIDREGLTERAGDVKEDAKQHVREAREDASGPQAGAPGSVSAPDVSRAARDVTRATRDQTRL